MENIFVDFVGEGPTLNFLQELTLKFGIESQVNFLGWQSRELIADTLCENDLLIQPSFCEGCGLTVIETFSAKIPVLVSNSEGPNEIINDDEFGFAFQSGDVDDLVSKIVYIYSNIELVNLKANLAYSKRLFDFDINATLKKYLSIYNNA